MGRPTEAHVSLAALTHNCRQAGALVGDQVRVIAVVKADGYGHGAVAAAHAFLRGGAPLLGVSSLAEADDVAQASVQAQIERFRGAVAALREAGVAPGLVHLANSAAVLSAPAAHFDAVRPGIMLYGYAPAPHLASRAALKPAMQLVT